MNAIAFALKKITLEPTIFGLAFGCAIEGGAQITTNLLIEKICHNELNYTKETCANFSNEGFEEDIKVEVQKEVNNFLMVSQWIGQTPALVYSFIGRVFNIQEVNEWRGNSNLVQKICALFKTVLMFLILITA